MRGYLALLRGSITIGLVYRTGFLFTIFGNMLYKSLGGADQPKYVRLAATRGLLSAAGKKD